MLTKNHIEKMHSFLFGMLGAMATLIIVHYISQPPSNIVTVNITGIVEQFIKDESKKNLSPDVLKDEVKEFGNKLEITLRKYAHQNHLVLLPNEAVIAGSQDHTAIIINSINHKYNGADNT